MRFDGVRDDDAFRQLVARTKGFRLREELTLTQIGGPSVRSQYRDAQRAMRVE
jgi:hypothetical protein